MSQSKNAPPVRWLYLLLGAVSMLFAGIIYAWSILKAPLAEEFGWSASQLSLNFTLVMCFFCVGGLLAGFASKRIAPKVIAVLSAPIVCCGFFLASRIEADTLWLLYLGYGVLAGFGIGAAYNVIISMVNRWFPDRKGLCSGVLMMSFGVSSLVLGTAADALIGNDAFGWRRVFILLGLVLGGVLLLTGLLLRLPPEGTTFPVRAKAAGSAASAASRDYTSGEMIQKPSFWKFCLFNILLAAVGSTMISCARDISLSVGASAGLATTLVGVLSICNGLGRILCGLLFDTAGRRRTMLLAGGITVIAPTVTLLAILSNSLPLCILGMCLCGLSYGFSPTISSALISEFYGTKFFATNFSIANLTLIPASFVATLAGSIVTATGTFFYPFLLLIVFSIISLLFNLSIRQP